MTLIAGRECVLGCDVSRWQGGINYGVFNLDFVFVKASGGDGGLYVDPKWLANAGGFAAECIPEGPYHFAGRGSPETEAEFFCTTILNSPWADLPSDKQLPPTLDAEWTNPHFGAGSADWSLRFLRTVEDRTQIEPIIYTAGWVGLEPDPRLLDYAFWLAAYVANPDAYPCPPWGNDWALWQYSSTGSVSGINGNCDTDAARTDWFASVLGHIPGPPPSNLPGGAMEIFKFPDKDDLFLYGIDRDGEWCVHIPSPDSYDPALIASLPVRMLGVGDDDLDARFHRLTGL